MKLSAKRFGSQPFPSTYDVVHQCTLNKADLSANNNKFYIIEGHKSKDGTQFRLYSRYGRVGAQGVEEERYPPQTDSGLKEAFDSLKKEKTSARKGYKEVAVAVSHMGSSEARGKLLSTDVKNIKDDDTKKVKKKKTKSVVIPDVKTSMLISRLFRDAGQAIKNSLSASAKSSEHNPLGVLTTKQIQDGRSILQEIQVFLSNNPDRIGSRDKQLIQWTNDFYSMIPQELPLHMTDRVASLILNTADRIDNKEDLLKLLEDAEVMRGGFESDDLEEKYADLGCTFTTADDQEFKRIQKLVEGTQSDHHRWHGKINVRNVWKVDIKGQRAKHGPKIEQIGNVKSLFHGSRDCNIAGICKRGLLMRPRGVYVTGSMFGSRALYFASQSSKSAQYCSGRFGGGGVSDANTRFMFVTQVALGKIKKYEDAQPHLDAPPKGYDSVQGVKGRSLLHDEHMIYDIRQHILDYLVEFAQN